MNKTKIEWTDYTWSSVTGCLNNCTYCYARAISKRFGWSFEPTFHEDRLGEPGKVKKPSKIFVCSMGELFGPWVDTNWIDDVCLAANEADQHTYIWLTKFPENITNRHWTERDWIGTSVTNNYQFMDARNLNFLPGKEVRFISFEPLLGRITFPMKVDYELLANILGWIIIGAETGPGAKQPQWEWVEEIIYWADAYNIPVFLKNNLQLPKGFERRKEFPEKQLREAL